MSVGKKSEMSLIVRGTALGKISLKRGTMPKIINGHNPEDPETEVDPNKKLLTDLLRQYQSGYLSMTQLNLADPVLLCKLSVVALSQLSAMHAVDVGMNPEQFFNICKANYSEAFKRAPKFH